MECYYYGWNYNLLMLRYILVFRSAWQSYVVSLFCILDGRSVPWQLSWWLHWLSVGLVIERSQVRLPAGALSSQLGQLSLPSLRGR